MNVFETVGIVYLVVIDIIIITGNIFGLCVICINQRLRNATGFIMANLLLSDLILGAVIPLSIHTLMTGTWDFGPIGCLISGYVITVANCAANWALCLVSVERYFAIVWPFRHGLWARYIKYIAVILWFFNLSHNAVMFTYTDGFALVNDMYMCGPNLPEYPMYIVMLNIFDIAIPNIVILFAYIKIYREVQRHNKQITTHTMKSNSSKEDPDVQVKAAEWKAALVIIAVVGVFNICWVPFGMGMLAYALKADLPYGLAASLFWIALTNAGINPLVYLMLNRSYRKEIGRMLKCQLPIQRELSAVSL